MNDRICSQCETRMIKNLYVGVETGMYHFAVKQKRRGFMNNVSERLHAAVCPNCGNVALYVQHPAEFQEE